MGLLLGSLGEGGSDPPGADRHASRFLISAAFHTRVRFGPVNDGPPRWTSDA
jgi:hypothetical protein